jgi:hypothetical protein
MPSRNLAEMTPEQIGLELLLPAIAQGGKTDRNRATIARLLSHPQATTLGAALDIEAQAALDSLVTNGYLTRDPHRGRDWLVLTRKGRERAVPQR